MKRRIIINADDYGFSKGITDGILLAHHEGIVSSASLMANMPASMYAIDQLKHAPRLGIGVHLFLCEGRPVLPPERVPTLVTSEGVLPSAPEMIRRLSRRLVSSAEVEDEFTAQIEWIQQRGVELAHADSHHHLHLYPAAVMAWRRALRRRGIRRVRAPRHFQFPANGRVFAAHAGGLLRRAMVTSYMEVVQRVVLRGFSVPLGCPVPPHEYRRNLPLVEEGLALLFENLPPGTYEMGCHPGISQPDFVEAPEFGARRTVELEALRSSRLKAMLREKQIDLITYAQMDEAND